MNSSTSSFKWLAALALSAVLLQGAAFIGSLVLPRTPYDASNYLLGMLDNQTRLARTASEDRRVVLLGGSSLAWAVSAAALSDKLETNVINLGVHAGVGYRNILKFHHPQLNPARDIVVLSPEFALVQETAHLTQDYCEVLRLGRLISAEAFACGGRNFLTSLKGLQYIGQTRDPEYRRDGFNAFGDYTYHYDKPGREWTARRHTPDDDLTSDIAAYNDFVRDLVGQGFKVVLIPAIAATSACADPFDYHGFTTELAAGTDIHFDAAYPFCLPDRYFFNTGYHMTSEGIEIKTDIFAGILTKILAK